MSATRPNGALSLSQPTGVIDNPTLAVFLTFCGAVIAVIGYLLFVVRDPTKILGYGSVIAYFLTLAIAFARRSS